MPKRFIFRMTHINNLEMYFRDGFINAKNGDLQPGYQISYGNIVNRRGGDGFSTPCGKVVNDFVPFYFSPLTAMAYTINCGNVRLLDPTGQDIGTASMEDVAFIICDPETIAEHCMEFWFTDIACNSGIKPNYCRDLRQLEEHINWSLFDESPRKGLINEIGYQGVCQYFADRDAPSHHQNRKSVRMAEFLVAGKFPMKLATCVILKHDDRKIDVEKWISDAGLDIPVITKLGCYF